MQPEAQQRNNCDCNQGDEDEYTSLTICKQTESSPTENDTEQETTMISNQHPNVQCLNVDEPQKLKLIVRSQYWGRALKGRTCRNVHTKLNVKAPRVISSQAVLYHTDGFWGCCPNHGKRVLELQEYHFSAVGCDWDLYLVGTWVSPGQHIHDFFLLPQQQDSVDIRHNEIYNRWSFVGTCKKDNIQSGIDGLLRNLLEQNNTHGHRYHHAHIDIMMDEAFDRETPRSRKLNNEKLRAERRNSTNSTPKDCERQESSVSSDGTASTEQATTDHESPPSFTSQTSNKNNQHGMKSIGAPPIPRVINNDSTMVSGSYPLQAPHSLPTPEATYRDAGWTVEPTYWNHERGTVSSLYEMHNGRSATVATDCNDQHVYWQSGKNMAFSGGLPPHPYPCWQTFPAPVPHPPYPVPDVHHIYNHQNHQTTFVYPGMHHMYHQPMGGEMHQYFESMHLHPHYPHTTSPSLHSNNGVEAVVANDFNQYPGTQVDATSEVANQNLPLPANKGSALPVSSSPSASDAAETVPPDGDSVNGEPVDDKSTAKVSECNTAEARQQ